MSFLKDYRPIIFSNYFQRLLISGLLIIGMSLPLASTSELPKRLKLNAELDSELSPYTGYTREHWLEITERFIAGVLNNFDPETGLPNLENPPETGHYEQVVRRHVRTSLLEAFDRSLMLVVFYTKATGKDRVPGYEGSVTQPYLDQMRAGADPESDKYWGRLEGFDITATNFAFAAQMNPEFFWYPFTEAEKANILTVFEDLSQTRAYDNNHWFFHSVPVPILEKYGRPSNREKLTWALQRNLYRYTGEGWFIDGSNRGYDYYNHWGYFLHGNMLVYLDEDWRALFGKRMAETTDAYLKHLPLGFGRNGAPIPWGRSVTYRFGVLSGLGWAMVNGHTTISPGLARRISSGCLKYFWENGALAETGYLEPGFHGPNAAIAENYIGRGAPYWAIHGLTALMLPKDHPFWTAAEEPMPADLQGGSAAFHHAGILMRVRENDGDARFYPVAQPFRPMPHWQRGIKYGQLAYSSSLGWSATGEGGEDLGAGRNGYSYDGNTWQYRASPVDIKVSEHHLISEEPMTLTSGDRLVDGGNMITHTFITDHGELHIFWHTSATPAYMHLGGYGISVPHGQKPRPEISDNTLSIQSDSFSSAMKVIQAPQGQLQYHHLDVRPGWKHSHLFGGRGAYPFWVSDQPVPPNTPCAIYVDGTASRELEMPDIEIVKSKMYMDITIGKKPHRIKIPD